MSEQEEQGEVIVSLSLVPEDRMSLMQVLVGGGGGAVIIDVQNEGDTTMIDVTGPALEGGSDTLADLFEMLAEVMREQPE